MKKKQVKTVDQYQWNAYIGGDCNSLTIGELIEFLKRQPKAIPYNSLSKRLDSLRHLLNNFDPTPGINTDTVKAETMKKEEFISDVTAMFLSPAGPSLTRCYREVKKRYDIHKIKLPLLIEVHSIMHKIKPNIISMARENYNRTETRRTGR